MHQTVDYSKYTDPAEKRQRALKDVKNWVGIRKFDKVSKQVRACQLKMTFAQFEMMCSIGGIEGYPVVVWAEECNIEIPQEVPQEAKSV